MGDKLYQFFTSLKLAVVLLALGIFIVFFGTLAQGHFGLYMTQVRYFQSFFIDLQALYVGFHKFVDMMTQGFGHPLAPLDGNAILTIPRIPVFPGGYLVGGLLLINLFCAHLRYYQPGKRKIGIAMIHLGVVLLLLGQLFTDLLSTESSMHIREGQSKNYSESTSLFELAVVDTSDAATDKVVAFPTSLLAKGGSITHADLPFAVSAKKYFANSSVTNGEASGHEQFEVTGGFAKKFWWRELPRETAMDRRDIPSALIQITAKNGEAQAFAVSGFFGAEQEFTFGGKTYQLSLRNTRYYKPFSLQLADFRFDRYAGTQIAMNYSSRVRLQQSSTGEDREVVIRMNEPLRFGGETFYQASFDSEDEKGTVLQVVRNPSWLAPYLACGLVAFGMTWQFLTHLIRFTTRRAAK